MRLCLSCLDAMDTLDDQTRLLIRRSIQYEYDNAVTLLCGDHSKGVFVKLCRVHLG